MPREERVPLPQPVSVREALEPSGITIDVREGQTVVLEPQERRCTSAYRVAHIRAFDDMKELGFIPNYLSERDSIQAIQEDTNRYREYVRSMGTCSCDDEVRAQPIQFRRRDFLDSFVQLLQPSDGKMVARNSAAVLHPYFHISQWVLRVTDYYIGLIRLQDINIADNATLKTLDGIQGLYANDINMGKNSRLSLLGGGVHVRCERLNGPEPFVEAQKQFFIRGFSRRLAKEVRS